MLCAGFAVQTLLPSFSVLCTAVTVIASGLALAPLINRHPWLRHVLAAAFIAGAFFSLAAIRYDVSVASVVTGTLVPFLSPALIGVFWTQTYAKLYGTVAELRRQLLAGLMWLYASFVGVSPKRSSE